MFRSFAVVFFLTVIGHLLSVLFYPFAGNYLSSQAMRSIAYYDSALMLMVSVLGFGISATTTRDVALSLSHKEVVQTTQRARIGFAIALSVVSPVLFMLDQISQELFVVMLFSLVVALNYDYVLYGLGAPRKAAVVSFVRLGVPLLLFMTGLFLGLIKDSAPYFFLLIASLLLSSSLVAKYCDTPLWFRPNFKFFHVYFAAGWVGVVSLCSTFQRFGFLTFLDQKLNAHELVLLATVLKFGIFAIAGKRMLIQFFYKYLTNDKYCSIINAFLTLTSSMFVAVIFFAGDSIASASSSGHILGLDMTLLPWIALYAAALLFFPLSDARLLLMKKDKILFIINVFFFFIFLLFFLLGSLSFEGIMTFLIAIEYSISIALMLGVMIFKYKMRFFIKK